LSSRPHHSFIKFLTQLYFGSPAGAGLTRGERSIALSRAAVGVAFVALADREPLGDHRLRLAKEGIGSVTEASKQIVAVFN